jgi:hypothetical protein
MARVVDDAGAQAPTGLRGHRALLGALSAGPEEREEETEARFTAAIHEYEALHSPVYLARARAAYGAWLTRQGRVAEAEPLLEEARATYETLGATRWLAELEGALQEAPA